jgi:hypothetical protein
MRGRLVIGLVGVLAVMAMAACGGDDDSSSSGGGGGGSVSAEAQPYVDALKKDMTTREAEDDLVLTSQQADCVAPKWINTIGVAKLKEKGLTPEDIGSDSDSDFSDLELTEAQGNALVDAFDQCKVDLKGVFLKSMNPSMSAEDEKCLNDNFDATLLKQIMVTSLTKGDDALSNDQELTGKLLAVFSKCPGAIPSDDSTPG